MAPRPDGRTGPVEPLPDLSVLATPERVAAVEALVSQGPAGTLVEQLTAVAARALRTSTAQVSLIGATSQVVAALTGPDPAAPGAESPLEDSLCSVTAASGSPLVVPDARAHPWVRELPPVTGGAVGAYLGVVLHGSSGVVLGSLCVHDPSPRDWTSTDVELLTALARPVATALEDAADLLRRDAEEVRRELAVEAAGLASFELDVQTGRSVWDARMLALHGSPEDHDGTRLSFDAVVHPEDLGRVDAAFEHAVATLGELAVDYRVRLPGGGTRRVRARGRVLPDMRGRPRRLLGAAYDASGEWELRDELTRLLDAMPAGFARLDRDGRVLYANHVAARLAGTTRDELVGRQVWAVPEARGTDFEAAFRRALTTGEPDVVELWVAPLDAWLEVHVWPDEQGLSSFFHDVSDRKRTSLALESVSERLSVLSSAGARLSSSLHPRQVLSVLTDLLVPELGDWAVVVVGDEPGELLRLPEAGRSASRLHPVQSRHADPAQDALLRQVVAAQTWSSTTRTGAGAAVRTGSVQTLPVVPDRVLVERARTPQELAAMRVLNTGPVLSVPLRSPSGVLGAFTVGGASGRPVDQLLLTDLGARAGVAFDNALSYARQRRAATLLQDALLPQEAPSLPDVQVATRYKPAAADALAGGDFYKTVVVDGRLVMMLGDVMGHGTSSAARAGQLHGLAAALALEGHAPGALLGRLAQGVSQMMDLQLATLVVCSYDPATRVLVTASAGHPPPLVAALGRPPEFVDVDPGPPIGVAVGDYAEQTRQLEPASTVVLFSDGLVERRGESITTGLERLRTALHELQLPPEAAADHVLERCAGSAGWDDDVALLVFSHL